MEVINELRDTLREINEAGQAKVEEALELEGDEQRAAFVEAERIFDKGRSISRLLLEANQISLEQIVTELEMMVVEEKARQSDVLGRIEEVLASFRSLASGSEEPIQEETNEFEDEFDEDSIGDEGDSSDEDSGLVLRSLPPPPSDDSKIVLTEAHLNGLWKRSNFPIFADGTIVFGIRGALPIYVEGTSFETQHEIRPADLDYRTMRCTIGQWHPGKGIALFPGSTVPYGPSVEKRVPSSGVGINQIGRGRYKKYFAGWHKRREGANGHWALLQECAISIQRTGDDADFDLHDRWESGRIAGDNIHCAFGMGTGDNIPGSKYSSFGCSVVAGTVIKGEADSESGPWKKFIETFNKADGQKTTEYVLYSAAEVIEMIKRQCVGKSVILRFGSYGPLVAQLQQKLTEKLGRSVKVDKDFGPATFEAVLEFQEMVFGPTADDGIVGPETAEKLGFNLPDFDFYKAISAERESLPGGERSTPGRSSEFGGLDDRGASGNGRGDGVITEAQFTKLARRPLSGWRRDNYVSYLSALTSQRAGTILKEYGVSDTKKRLAHFLGQAIHETGGFTVKRESLNYTSVERIRQVWPSRTNNMSDQQINDRLVRNERAIGDFAYGNRMGNGKSNGDGYRYRGGGVFQTTGRAAYRRHSEAAGVDLENNPDFIEDPITSLLTACSEWQDFGGNSMADAGDVRKISRALNRGNASSSKPAIGEADRIKDTNKALLVLS